MPPVSQRWAQSVLWCMCQASQDVRPAGSGLCPAWKICLIYMFYFQLLFGCIFAKIKHQEVLTMRLYVRCAWANCICTKGLKKKRQAGKDNKQTLDSVGEALRIWRWSKKEVVVNYLNSARLLKSTEVRAQSTIQGKSTPGVLCLSLGIFFFLALQMIKCWLTSAQTSNTVTTPSFDAFEAKGQDEIIYFSQWEKEEHTEEMRLSIFIDYRRRIN